KAALALDQRSFSRRVLQPIVRPIARAFLIVVAAFRLVVPQALTSSRLLHYLIYIGLKYFVTPQASFLILRHFHLGSNVLRFLASNSGEEVPTEPLRPLRVEDVRDHLFLKHDLNLYNFIIALNTRLAEKQRGLVPAQPVDFTPIDERPIQFAPFRRGFTNVLDCTTAIELYTPLYHLLLGERDFSRAVLSLQLDETLAVYAARVLGDGTHLAIVNNRHPLIPLTSLRAGFRLVLHGLATELLHAVLVEHKLNQRTGASPADHGLRSLFMDRARVPS
ncbi:MAG TPA: hypothetical protein VFQ35_28425, partial [Polyangiaceae bacterium]|nr:hypothetical protein [Polyangiaceae bacterium]